MLLPLYLIYPLYYAWLKKGHRKIKAVSVLIGLLAVAVMMFLFKPELYSHLEQIIVSYLFLTIGNYIAEDIYNKKFNPLWLFLFSVIFFAFKFILNEFVQIEIVNVIGYAFFGIILSYLFALISTKIFLSNKKI